MALLIEYVGSAGLRTRREWHVGEPLAPMKARVVTFTADGDELEVIEDALKRAAAPPPVIRAEVVADPKLEASNENSGS